MKIGSALKEERLKLGISKYEFCKGIIDRSFYSKVENDNRNLGSEALVKLLLKNCIDIASFFYKIQNSYMSEEDFKYEELNKKIGKAFNSGDEISLKGYLREINPNSDLWLRGTIALAYLNGEIERLKPQFLNKVNEALNKHDNYVQDVKAFRLLTNSLPVLSSIRIDEIINVIIKRYEKRKLSTLERERLIILYDNYCQTCHDRKYDGRHLEHIINYLTTLNEIHFDIYKVAGKFDKALVENKYDIAKEIKKSMVFLGLENRIKNWNI